MSARSIRYFNLLVTSTLVGNEMGIWVGLHPALNTLPPQTQVQTEQAVVWRFFWVMPVWVSCMLASYVPVLVHLRHHHARAFQSQLASLLCFLAMLGVTFIGNMPINRRIARLTPTAPPPDWSSMRTRWDRWHALRLTLDLVGLLLLYHSALNEIHRTPS